MLAKRIEEDTRSLQKLSVAQQNFIGTILKKFLRESLCFSKCREEWILFHVSSLVRFYNRSIEESLVNQYFRLDPCRFEEYAHASKKNDNKKKKRNWKITNEKLIIGRMIKIRLLINYRQIDKNLILIWSFWYLQLYFYRSLLVKWEREIISQFSWVTCVLR